MHRCFEKRNVFSFFLNVRPSRVVARLTSACRAFQSTAIAFCRHTHTHRRTDTNYSDCRRQLVMSLKSQISHYSVCQN